MDTLPFVAGSQDIAVIGKGSLFLVGDKTSQPVGVNGRFPRVGNNKQPGIIQVIFPQTAVVLGVD